MIGGRRGIGKEICLAAAERGHHVRALSRSGSAPSGAGGAIEPMSGNALDRGDIDRALQGVETVVQALGVPANLDLLNSGLREFSKAHSPDHL